MESCIFCKIIKGEISAEVVYKDDSLVVIKDINPQAPVHVLVVPRKHIPSITDEAATHGELLASIFKTIKKLSESLNLEKGFRIVINNGEEGGQTVSHIHFHLLGRRLMSWPPG